MKPAVMAGIVLIIAGIIGLASGRTIPTDRERILEASGERHRAIPLTKLVGAVAVAAGVGLLIVGNKRG